MSEPAAMDGIDRMMETIQKQSEGWKTVSVNCRRSKTRPRLSPSEASPGSASVDADGGQRYRSDCSIEAFRDLDPGEGPPVDAPVHTGEYYGLWAVIARIASLAGDSGLDRRRSTYRRFFSSQALSSMYWKSCLHLFEFFFRLPASGCRINR